MAEDHSTDRRASPEDGEPEEFPASKAVPEVTAGTSKQSKAPELQRGLAEALSAPKWLKEMSAEEIEPYLEYVKNLQKKCPCLRQGRNKQHQQIAFPDSLSRGSWRFIFSNQFLSVHQQSWPMGLYIRSARGHRSFGLAATAAKCGA